MSWSFYKDLSWCRVFVDDTQLDLLRNIRSRLIRGPLNPVKDGGPLATQDLAWQDLSFLVLRALCVSRSTIDAYDAAFHIDPLFISQQVLRSRQRPYGDHLEDDDA